MEKAREVLEKLKNGEISIEEAEQYFRSEPFKEMGFAKLDTHRELRSGFPEVIFCPGKTDEFLLSIYEKMLEENGRAFGTRATKEQFEVIRAKIPEAQYDPVSRILKVEKNLEKNDSKEKKSENIYSSEKESRDLTLNEGIGLVAICCAGTADVPVAEEAAQTAEYFGTKVERVYDVGVSGIHRLLSNVEILQKANCVIAIAGMEGALASVVGGLVKNPVIAVPTSVGYGASFEGLSALLTMINSCANGVAVVNIDNGYGAGYLATQINRLAEGSKNN